MRDRPALVELPRHVRRVCPAPAAPSAARPRSRRRGFSSAATSVGMPLVSIVEQRERRAAIDDIGAGAGDDVRPRSAVSFFLVTISTLSGRSARRAPSAIAW